ncbi:helix-turn-helix transcriptional regulator [Agromyces sp. H66]|uniref:helix-turn-helix transcriptional regulator n=1 Tax=Agromyces sp. H66 TaxID=2529859 RepID=UPI00145B3747|nr:helix-turn-helix transcriptional regulator [Agromyces sp. H66]
MRSIIAVLVPGEGAALGTRGFDGLVFGAVGSRLAESGDPGAVVRLARYEQFAGREVEADARLKALIDDTGAPAGVRREAASQRRLGIAFESEFGDIDWTREVPPSELDSVGVRELVAIAFGRLIADGREPEGGWADDFVPPDWAAQQQLVLDAAEALLRLLDVADRDEVLASIDLCVWVPMISLAHGDHDTLLRVVSAARRTHGLAGLRVLDVFFDYLEGITHVAKLEVVEAIPKLESAIAGFAQGADRRWWMLAKAAQALSATIARTELPSDLDELERALVAGTWRRGRRSLGQATLMLMAIVLASHGDLDGARRVALADGGLDELVVPNTDRMFVIEAVCMAALAEGDVETCDRMLRIADHMMASPFVVLVRDRIRVAVTAHVRGAVPAMLPSAEPDASFEQLRTRWLLLAQTVEHGERDTAFNALAEFDAYASRVRAAGVRLRAVRLFHARAADAAEVELSPRQLEVATLAAAGLANREIAERLFLGVRTVEGYIAGAMRALGLTRRSEFATAALPVRFAGADGRPSGEAVRLPLRQGQVAALIAAGASNAGIAAALGISEKTVDKHIAVIKQRIGVGTRTAIAAAFTGAPRS